MPSHTKKERAKKKVGMTKRKVAGSSHKANQRNQRKKRK